MDCGRCPFAFGSQLAVCTIVIFIPMPSDLEVDKKGQPALYVHSHGFQD